VACLVSISSFFLSILYKTIEQAKDIKQVPKAIEFDIIAELVTLVK